MSAGATTVAAARPIHPVAARRILRLGLGTALALLFSQMAGWTLSFIIPVLTLTILAAPIPALNLKKSIVFVLALLVPLIAAMALLPFLQYARWAGVLLVALALFYTFYFTARGGQAILGTFMTMGLTLTVTIGTASPVALLLIIESLAKCAVFGLVFVWLAHALLPDLPQLAAAEETSFAEKPDLVEARRNAFRSMMIVFPIALLFMFMSGSPAYTVVMIKVASMGQQASVDNSRTMGRSLLESTLWGGFGAAVLWVLLSAWPSLIFYTLLVGLAGLLIGRQIFSGVAVHPKFSMWSYAFLTMLIIIGPAVVDSPMGSGAEIWSRLMLFVAVAVYGTAAVAVFDAFWPAQKDTLGAATSKQV